MTRRGSSGHGADKPTDTEAGPVGGPRRQPQPHGAESAAPSSCHVEVPDGDGWRRLTPRRSRRGQPGWLWDALELNDDGSRFRVVTHHRSGVYTVEEWRDGKCVAGELITD